MHPSQRNNELLQAVVAWDPSQHRGEEWVLDVIKKKSAKPSTLLRSLAMSFAAEGASA